MEKPCFILLVVLAVGCFCASITTKDDVESYRKFLERSAHGKPTPPLNEKLRELQNEWERSGKFEGDIILTKEQQEALVADYKGDYNRNAYINTARLWPQKVLYYNITTTNFTTVQRTAIEDGLKYLGSIACVKFVKANSTSKAYVTVQGKPDGCYSTIGYTGGVQVLNLAPNTVGNGCFRNGTVVHEFLHALGFFHMQSTYDRDNYVKIVYEKILPGTENNFAKYSNTTVTNLNETYDYGSVMHYSEYSFSIDGNKTIIPLKTTTEVIGQRVKLSTKDITRLNRLYKCPGF